MAAGAFFHAVAVHFSSPLANDFSNALLFLPATLATMWLGWRRFSSNSLLVALPLAISFYVRFQVSWWETDFATIRTTNRFLPPRDFLFNLQLAHWLLFLTAGAFVARTLQWGLKVGIWRKQQTANTALQEPPPAPLSLLRWMIIMTVIALGSLLYQTWYRSFHVVGSPAWHELFPVGSRAWAAGLIGGLLIPIHWLAIAWVLAPNADSRKPSSATASLFLFFKIAILLCAWCAIATLLRHASNHLYFYNPTFFIPAEDAEGTMASRWILYSLGLPFIPAVDRRWDAVPWQTEAVQATIQTALTVASIRWIAKMGFRVGPKS